MWFRYYVLYSLQKMGEFRRGEKKYTKRTSGTIAPFPEFNAESLAWVYDTLIHGVDTKVFDGKEHREELLTLATKLL